jgi:uncharacterized membrane protein YbaN (DUF454 family)
VDNSEAKLILSAYRPDGQEALDPCMKEALEQAQRDPELRQWLEDQQRFDRVICDKLKCCGVPKDLKSTILAGHKTIEDPRLWRHSTVWAAAALFLILISLGYLWIGEKDKPTLSQYRDEVAQAAIAMIDHGITLDYQSADNQKVIEWVKDRQLASRFTLTKGMDQSKPFGCKSIQWRGHPVAMVCFKGPDNQVAHLFILKRDLLSGIPERQLKEIVSVDGLPIASWFDQANVYVLVGDTPRVRIEDFL